MSTDDRDVDHALEVRAILDRTAKWGRHPSCGCPSSWDHQCGKPNAPAPTSQDEWPWTPSPYGRGGVCGGRCAIEVPSATDNPYELGRLCPCRRETAG